MNTEPIQPIQPLLLTVAQASKILNIGRTKIYELMRCGELPAIHVGKAVRFSYHELQQWVEQQARKEGESLLRE